MISKNRTDCRDEDLPTLICSSFQKCYLTILASKSGSCTKHAKRVLMLQARSLFKRAFGIFQNQTRHTNVLESQHNQHRAYLSSAGIDCNS